ncbi:hypothetical protein GJAV_G00259810 [Gymnothorax javanicus]|nr:hypothetical protein GJAV_G00259810 [Gymnothorax javanicus]
MPNRPFPTRSQLHNFVNSQGGIIALTIVLMVLQYATQMDFLCPCEDEQNKVFGALYLVLPFITLFWFVLLINPKEVFQKNRKSTFLRALLLAMLWLITALLDGDVVACLAVRSNNIEGGQVVCLQASIQSAEDQRNISYYKNVSYMSGFGVILFILLISSLCEIRKYTCPKAQGTDMTKAEREKVCDKIKAACEGLPDLELSSVVETLESLGGKTSEDFQYIKEEDLLTVLKPVQARKLASLWTLITQGEAPSNAANQHENRSRGEERRDQEMLPLQPRGSLA